jgi:hypothetical protein
VFDALVAGASAARVVEAVQLLEATFQRLLVEERFDVASELLRQMNAPRVGPADLAIRQALDRMAHPKQLAQLHRALETGACEPDEAKFLLLGLGECAVEPVCALLADSNDEKIRRFYADVLVEIGSPALEPVVAHLRSTHSELQCQFVRVLGQLREPAAAEALIEVLGTEDPSARREAVRALATIGGALAVTRLLELALEDPDSSVRVVSLICLGEARAQLDYEQIGARIKSFEFSRLSHEEKDLLFQALAAAGGADAIPDLRRRLQPSWIPGRSDRDNWRRAAAALAQIGTPAAIEVLEGFSRSRRPDLSRICHEFLKVAQREQP